MANRKIVYLDKNTNEVILQSVLDESDIKQYSMLAALLSNPKFIEIDMSIPADFGWKYIDGKLIQPDGTEWAS